MSNFITQIWNDQNLYGHCLTKLPNQLWNATISSDNFWSFTPSDHDIVHASQFPFFPNHTAIRTYPNGNIRKITFANRCMFLEYIELGCRSVIGTCLTVVVSLPAAPLGKIIHKTVLGIFP